VKSLGRIIRSVKAFGRGLSGTGSETQQVPRQPRIGLALGGGFARGIAHVGILKVLEEENIPISFIAGTSVGALIGAAYCGGLSPADLVEVAKRVRFRGRDVPLSAREYALLEALADRPGRVMSRAQLEERLYGWDEEIASNAVEVHIHALRRKLDAALIRNVRGLGYSLATEA